VNCGGVGCDTDCTLVTFLVDQTLSFPRAVSLFFATATFGMGTPCRID
jgi:hypothetical protein